MRTNMKAQRLHLADLYRLLGRVEREVARLELELEEARCAGRLRRTRIDHGDESAYQRHIRQRIPFPEDAGREPCGCRLAHSRYEQRRAARQKERAT